MPRCQAVQNIFNQFKQGEEGVILLQDLKLVAQALGHVLSESELDQLSKDVDEDGSGTIDLEEFMELADRLDGTKEPEGQPQLSQVRMAELKDIFKRFKRGNDDAIAIEDLSQVVKALGNSLSKAELNDLIQEVDEDGSGTLDFDEYLELAARFTDMLSETTLSSTPQPSFLKEGEIQAVFSKHATGEDPTISVEFLGSAINSLGYFPNPAELHCIVQNADEDGSGALDFEEFSLLATKLESRKDLMHAGKIQQPLVDWLSGPDDRLHTRDKQVACLMSEATLQSAPAFDAHRLPLHETIQFPSSTAASVLAACRRDLRIVMSSIDRRLPKSQAKIRISTVKQ